MDKSADTQSEQGLEAPFRWFRPFCSRRDAPRYDEKTGLIRATSNPKAWYEPFGLDFRTLPAAFVKVADDRSAVAFVKRYGRLGWYDTLERKSQATVPEGWERGDPLAWALAQAATVRFALELIAALEPGKEGRLDRVLLDRVLGEHRISEPAPFAGSYVIAHYFACLGSERSFPASSPLGALQLSQGWYRLITAHLPSEPDDGALRRHGWHLLKQMANANTAGIRPVLHLNERLRYDLTAQALIEVIWRHVTDTAVGGHVRFCRECGKPFVVTQGRQSFCPPEPLSGSTRRRLRSNCEERWTKRQQRDRKEAS